MKRPVVLIQEIQYYFITRSYTAIQSICTINNVIFTMKVKLESNFKHMIGLLIVVDLDLHSNISFYQLLQY